MRLELTNKELEMILILIEFARNMDEFRDAFDKWQQIMIKRIERKTSEVMRGQDI